MDAWHDPSFLAALDAIEECVLVLDVAGQIRVARGTARLDSICADPVGRHYAEALPGPAALEVKQALEALGSGAARIGFRLEQSGQPRHLRGKVGALSRDGQRVGALIIVRDATAEVTAEAARRESEAFYRLLAENSSDIISVKTPEGRFLYISPSLERLTGRRAGDLIGKLVDDVWNPDDLARARAATPDGTLMPPQQGARILHRILDREGRWIWMESEARPIDWQGQRAVICDTRDITRRKLAEEKARAAMAELEEARGKAEAASQVKSDFLAAMSHALRTPLHGILGMAELLQQTHLGDHQREYLDAIRESGRLLHSLLNDLQDLNKIESGRLDLRSVPFDLVETVEGLEDLLAPEAGSHGLELLCQVSPELPTVVVGDPDRLRQVLVNLLGVAIKSGARGALRLTARAGSQEGIHFSLVIGSVSSERAGRQAVREAGPALSLSIARGLVTLLGGQLRGEVQAGQVVEFELPLTAAQQAFTAENAPIEGKRILLALVSAEDRLRLRQALEGAGAEVELASGGVEVIRTLRDDPHYQCVIVDAGLADIDGSSVAALIRARAELAGIPIVLVSGLDDRPGFPAVELNARLSKPVRPDLLVRAVTAVLSGGRFDQDSYGGGHDRTVLLVEDNEVNLRLARDMLRHAGYRVIGARAAAEALQQLDRYTVDAVLMDIQLPDMDGLEATARIRRLPAGARLPIIAMTAHAMKGDAERFMEAGLDDYLSKPVNQEELLQALARGIRRRAGLLQA